VVGRRAEEVAGKSEANRVLVRAAEKADGNNIGGNFDSRFLLAGEDWNDTDPYFDWARFFRAALAPFLPRAVRVFFDKCSIVLSRLATLAAFLMFRFAAARCLFVGTISRNVMCPIRSSARCGPRYSFQRRRFRVCAAFFAEAERERAERCFATRFACLDNACLDAERRLSRLRARFVARDRFREGFLRRPARPFARSRFA